MKKLSIFAVLALGIIGIYYFVFQNKYSEFPNDVSQPMVGGNKYLDTLSDNEIRQVVFNTLPDKVIKPQNNGKIFCVNHLYGYDKDNENKLVEVYLFAYCEEYFLKEDKITLGNGVSVPLKLVFEALDNKLVFKDLTAPKEGSLYKDSLSQIFTNKYLNEALKGIDTNDLVPSPGMQAENYFKGKLEVYF